jgi:hypothetical protein
MRFSRLKFDPADPRVVACKKAVQNAGGPTMLARKLTADGAPISVQGVHYWKIVPADRVLHVSLISGVSVHELRPDVFGTKPVVDTFS